MTLAVHVEGLSKRYQLGARLHSIRDLVNTTTSGLLRRATGRAKAPQSETERIFWALKDVSFDIHSGEIVGIVGRNGAGKSTLLKILSRIVSPTSGRVTLRGRVASLLEVGTGFHAELSGRENVFLNGAVLGMTKAEIRRKFDEIVAFAEIEQFIDTPVKRYSSGMYVRLAFAVAAHLEPEILIVDEVLTVGDASFQRKCLGKIGAVGKSGRTVLFVTHNMLALRSLCDRAILLEKGEVVLDAEPETATFAYLQSGGGECRVRHFSANDECAGANGVRLHSVRIQSEGDETERLSVDSRFFVEFDWEHVLPETLLHLNLQVNTPDGLCVFNTLTQPQHYQIGRYVSRCEIPGNLLNDGVFHLSLAFYREIARPVHTVEDIAIVEIHDKPRDLSWFGKWPGVVRPTLNWRTQIVESPLVRIIESGTQPTNAV